MLHGLGVCVHAQVVEKARDEGVVLLNHHLPCLALPLPLSAFLGALLVDLRPRAFLEDPKIPDNRRNE